MKNFSSDFFQKKNLVVWILWHLVLTRKDNNASFTFAHWHIAIFPSFVFVGGVTPNSLVVVQISTEVVISFLSPFVSMRCLFWPFLTLPSRNCCWYLSLVIFSSFTILANFQTILTILSSRHLCILCPERLLLFSANWSIRIIGGSNSWRFCCCCSWRLLKGPLTQSIHGAASLFLSPALKVVPIAPNFETRTIPVSSVVGLAPGQ